MSLFNDASLVLIPSGYKEDTIYSVKPTDGSGDLTFTRASDGTRVNSDGYIERVPWNLLQQSNQFDTTWTGAATTLSGQTGYDGSSNAWLITKPSLFDSRRQVVTTSGINTFSVYAKAGSYNWLLLHIEDSAGDCLANFDLSTGSLGSLTNGITSTIQNVGSGWYLCSVTFNRNVSDVRIYPSESGGYTGNSGSIYIQDAQLVEGSTAKPYFPTTDRLNVPRLDYSGGCPSLLLEPQRTNLVTYSENFSTWTTIGSPTITSNYGTSPSGIQNSTRIQGVSGDRIYLAISGTSATYTYSIYAKGSGTFKLRENTDTYNLSITPTSNWVRYDFSFTAAFTNIQIQLTSTCDIEIWGAQLEAGAYPTSYIPTTSASVTRVADAASKTGISSLIGQTEGTLFATINAQQNGTSSNWISVLDGTNTNWVFIGKDSSKWRAYVRANNVVIFSNTTTTITNNTDTKIAVAYKSGEIAFYINGTQIATNSSSFSFSATLTEFAIGLPTVAESSKYSNIILFKTRLTNAELAALTTL